MNYVNSTGTFFCFYQCNELKNIQIWFHSKSVNASMPALKGIMSFWFYAFTDYLLQNMYIYSCLSLKFGLLQTVGKVDEIGIDKMRK